MFFCFSLCVFSFCMFSRCAFALRVLSFSVLFPAVVSLSGPALSVLCLRFLFSTFFSACQVLILTEMTGNLHTLHFFLLFFFLNFFCFQMRRFLLFSCSSVQSTTSASCSGIFSILAAVFAGLLSSFDGIAADFAMVVPTDGVHGIIIR